MDKNKEIEHIIWAICDKHERMEVLLKFHDDGHLDELHSMKLLGEVWTIVDNGEDFWPQVEAWLRSVEPFARALMMDEDDLAALQALGRDKITIYRGGGPTMRRRLDLCPAWTTDRKVADKFAYIESPLKPVVLEATVRAEDVYAYFVGRKESELLLSPHLAPSFKLRKVIKLEPKDAKFAAVTEMHKAIHRRGIGGAMMFYQAENWHLLFSVAQLEMKHRVLVEREQMLLKYDLFEMAEKEGNLAQVTEDFIAQRRQAGQLEAPLQTVVHFDRSQQ